MKRLSEIKEAELRGQGCQCVSADLNQLNLGKILEPTWNSGNLVDRQVQFPQAREGFCVGTGLRLLLVSEGKKKGKKKKKKVRKNKEEENVLRASGTEDNFEPVKERCVISEDEEKSWGATVAFTFIGTLRTSDNGDAASNKLNSTQGKGFHRRKEHAVPEVRTVFSEPSRNWLLLSLGGCVTGKSSTK